ncbi:DNA methyltransferase [Amycolatopsis sp. NPDC050768]|uniref:site-specific DNA-methyltransferase n=1 Tax=Amycolatopsis sp. NPDC050768 TaxID=3154839 RepID=UPI003401238D
MSRLNDLIRQVGLTNPTLAADLQREVGALADRRSFGLNFERHVPEVVELPGRPVRRGDKVHVLPGRGTNPTKENSRLWRVTAIKRAAGIATIEDGDDTQQHPLTELLVAAEFRDPIYPGLVSTGRIERGGDKPFHSVINAENYHALQTLLFTHRGQVDCIYIDPPYNTGNEGWIYNDKYVASDDHYKHSKWLAFMERRLLLAKELLKATGVIIVAIGDEEHHRLRMLMDQVFGTENYLSQVGWQGGRKNDSRYVSNGTDYMLIYARSEAELAARGIRWRESKPGIAAVVAAAHEAWELSGHDVEEATKRLREWWRSLPQDHPTRASKHYDRVDGAEGRPGFPYFADNLRSPNPRPNLCYDVLHPITGKPANMHPNGWVYSSERMAELVAAGRIRFGADESTRPTFKRYLDEMDGQVPLDAFYVDRRAASRRIEGILGDKRFPNPKDHEVLGRWIRVVAPKDAVVLDFFAGSGSTAEAVMRVNAEDDGTRRCILVTNNEVSAKEAKALRKAGHRPGDVEWESKGVYEFVANPRISTVVTGIRPDGSTYSEGLEQNVEFFDLTYEAPLRVSSHREFERIAPLLWLRAGSRGRRIDKLSKGWDVAEAYGVLADLDQVDAFLHEMKRQESAQMAFIVTDEDRLFESVCRDLPDNVEPVRLYEAYLRNFEINSGRGAR